MERTEATVRRLVEQKSEGSESQPRRRTWNSVGQRDATAVFPQVERALQ